MQGAIVLSRLLAALIVCAGCGAAWNAGAQASQTGKAKPAAAPKAQQSTSSADQEADTIVAVVNKDIITQRELSVRLAQIRQELSRQKAPLPSDDILQR